MKKYFWSGRPQFWPFFIGGSIMTTLFALWYTRRHTMQSQIDESSSKKGVIGRDFDFLDLDMITSASVNVGVFDKLFGGNTGSI